MIDPELLRPPVRAELATDTPSTPIIVPLFVMLVNLALSTKTPAANTPVMRPELVNAPVRVEFATEIPELPVMAPAFKMLVALTFETDIPAPDTPVMLPAD